MLTIAVASHKGGSGKTTLAVNLAGVLADAGSQVLLVDADPQGAAGAALRVDAGEPNLTEMLYGQVSRAAIKATATPQLSVVPSDVRLAAAEVMLQKISLNWRLIMRQTLEPLATSFDYGVIDTAPGVSPLLTMALVAADGVLVACPPHYLAYRALGGIADTIEEVRPYNRGLAVIGIVPTMVSRQSRHERAVLDALHEHYSSLVLTEIPRRIALADAQIAGETITKFAPESDAASAFTQLATQIRSLTHPGSAQDVFGTVEPRPPALRFRTRGQH